MDSLFQALCKAFINHLPCTGKKQYLSEHTHMDSTRSPPPIFTLFSEQFINYHTEVPDDVRLHFRPRKTGDGGIECLRGPWITPPQEHRVRQVFHALHHHACSSEARMPTTKGVEEAKSLDDYFLFMQRMRQRTSNTKFLHRVDCWHGWQRR